MQSAKINSAKISQKGLIAKINSTIFFSYFLRKIFFRGRLPEFTHMTFIILGGVRAQRAGEKGVWLVVQTKNHSKRKTCVSIVRRDIKRG